MFTVIRLVDVYDRKLVFRNWRLKRCELYRHWLHFGELTDDIDGPSLTAEWLASNAIRLHGEWRNSADSLRSAQETADFLTAAGYRTVVDDIVGD